jgi:hypothetical protein
MPNIIISGGCSSMGRETMRMDMMWEPEDMMEDDPFSDEAPTFSYDIQTLSVVSSTMSDEDELSPILERVPTFVEDSSSNEDDDSFDEFLMMPEDEFEDDDHTTDRIIPDDIKTAMIYNHFPLAPSVHPITPPYLPKATIPRQLPLMAVPTVYCHTAHVNVPSPVPNAVELQHQYAQTFHCRTAHANVPRPVPNTVELHNQYAQTLGKLAASMRRSEETRNEILRHQHLGGDSIKEFNAGYESRHRIWSFIESQRQPTRNQSC